MSVAVPLDSSVCAAHSLEARYDCPDGAVTADALNLIPDWTVLLLS